MQGVVANEPFAVRNYWQALVWPTATEQLLSRYYVLGFTNVHQHVIRSTDRLAALPDMPQQTRYRPMILRRALACDASTLTDLAFRSKQSNGYDNAFMDACRRELSVSPAQIEADEIWLAESESDLGFIHGFVHLGLDSASGEAEIEALFVDPNSHRRGLGRLLLEKAIALATLKRAKSLRLDADPTAVFFYKAMGLVVVGEALSGSIAGRSIPRMAMALT